MRLPFSALTLDKKQVPPILPGSSGRKSRIKSGLRRRLRTSTAITMAVITMLGLGLPILGFITPQTVQASQGWWNEDYRYRQVINISHATSQDNVYHQFQLDTSASGKFKGDCSDLRFTTQSGQEVPYHIVSGCGTNNTQVQLLFSTLPAGNQDLYLYYGNPQASIVSSADPFNSPASGVTINSTSAEQPSPAPVAHWKFDEGYGTTSNSSTTLTGNSGSAATMNWLAEDNCISGKCLRLDGTASTQITTADQPYFSPANNDMTISVWAKVPRQALAQASGDCGGDGAYLMTKGQASKYEWGLEIENNTSVCFTTWSIAGNDSTYVQANFQANDDRWHHYAVVVDSNYPSLYIDGRQVGVVTTFGQPISDDTAPVRIGGRNNEFYFTGDLDEPKIYNYTRTQQQIQQDYIAGAQSLARQQANLSNGLIGHWKMDEDSWNGTNGEVKDVSGNTNHGTAGGASPITGKYGNAGQFDGVDDYVETTNTLTSGNSTTLSAWVYATAGNARVISWADRSLRIGCTDGPGLKLCGMTDNSGDWPDRSIEGPDLSLNGWHHLVFTTQDNKYLKLYLNGVVVASRTLADDKMPGPVVDQINIGRSPYGWENQFFEGYLDEARLYNRALNQTEVSQLYTYAPGPSIQLNFEEKTGSTAYDTSGNNKHAQVSGSRTVGKYGGALRAQNATGASIATGYHYGQQNLTMMAWVKSTDTQDEQSRIMGSSYVDGYVWLNFRNGTPTLEYRSDTDGGYWLNSAGINIADGQWHHIAAIVDRSNNRQQLLIDGIVRADDNQQILEHWNNSSGTYPFRIGYQNAWPELALDGDIDDVRVYNYARTPSQILSDMQSSMPGELNPVGHWKFDENQGAVANDSSGLDHHGTLGCVGVGCQLPQWDSDSKDKSGLIFNGQSAADNSMVTIPASQQLNPINYSISGWIKPSSTYFDASGTIISNGFSGDLLYRIGLNPVEKRLFLQWYNGVTSTAIYTPNNTLSLDEWSYITVIKQGATGSFYVNGRYISSGTVTPTTGAGGDVVLGRSAVSQILDFSGIIDDLKIYNHALTSQQIAIDYNQSSAMVVGATSTEPTISGTGQPATKPANSTDSRYCVPGSADYCAKPVAHYDFEEGSGVTAKDISGNGNNASLAGNATWKVGHAGKGLYLPSGGSSGTVSSMAGQLESELTVEAWVDYSATGSGNFNRIVNRGWVNNGWLLGVYNPGSGDRAMFGIGQSGVQYNATTSIVPGKVHLVGVYDGSKVVLYVNGIQVSSLNLSGATLDISSNIILGTSNVTPETVDDIRIYNYARTPSQVAWDYNNGKPVAHYKMDECQGAAIHDSSDNHLHAALNLGSSGVTSAGTCNTPTTAWSLGKMGKVNSAMNFDGVDDEVTIPVNPKLIFGTSDFSYCFWIKSTDNQGMVMGHETWAYSGWGAYAWDGGFIRFEIKMPNPPGIGYFLDSPVVLNGSWNHLCATVDRDDRMIVYANGNRAGSTSIAASQSIAVTGSGWPLSIGNGLPGPLQGQIDDVQIFNYALTPDQIKVIHNGGAVRWGP